MAKRKDEQQQLVLVDPHTGALYAPGGTNVVNDISMNGSPNAGSIVVQPEDKIGPLAEAPHRAFYVNAPWFHWHQHVVGAVDEPASTEVM